MLSQKNVLAGEEDFNLNKFRDSLYLRMQSPSQSKQSSVIKEDNSIKKSAKNSLNADIQRRKSVPSFDELLKTMNISNGFGQQQNVSNHKRNITDSSRKMSGIYNKIECLGNNEVNQITKLSQPFISNTPLSISNNQQHKRTTFSSSITEKPVFSKGNGKSLIDKLSLKELMEIRSKIDNSTQSEVQELSANYVQELLKLSQIIIKQVRHIKN
ncbi:unnamed protein product [Paramecium pentaurelia]|uniref:Uncharacterized protein n=1 Tax=Paramecium pentaurelia TaxID=43138 RepID=A0A8S1TGM3_9CILI|nr:unnamed protein product [Paramecium pentaurelia]